MVTTGLGGLVGDTTLQEPRLREVLTPKGSQRKDTNRGSHIPREFMQHTLRMNATNLATHYLLQERVRGSVLTCIKIPRQLPLMGQESTHFQEAMCPRCLRETNTPTATENHYRITIHGGLPASVDHSQDSSTPATEYPRGRDPGLISAR